MPTRQSPEARAAGLCPAPPTVEPKRNPKGISDTCVGVIRQGESEGEADWCALLELKDCGSNIGAQIGTGRATVRLRKRTKTIKRRNGGKSNLETKRKLISSARKVDRQRLCEVKIKSCRASASPVNLKGVRD